jgi:hypothetical protein
MNNSIRALVAAIALTFSATLFAQGRVGGTVTQIVQPTAGRQALPVGSVVKGGVDLGQVISGAEVILPNEQRLLDVLVMQVTRDTSGRIIGGTVSNKWGMLAQSGAQASAPAVQTLPPPSAVGAATGASMSGRLSPGMIAAIALGAAVVIGSGSSTPSHGQ